MTILAADFRDALRLFPSGVTLVTLRVGEVIHGLTVSAFASVSPEPPLVTVIIDHRHRAHQLLELPGARFAVNFRSETQVALSNRFAWTEDEDRFQGDDWDLTGPAAPEQRTALAWLDCRIHSKLSAGTHTLYVGEVERVGGRQATQRAEPAEAAIGPLIYWNRDYRGIKDLS